MSRVPDTHGMLCYHIWSLYTEQKACEFSCDKAVLHLESNRDVCLLFSVNISYAHRVSEC